MNYESKFNESTMDDGDNKFEQMEEIIKKVEDLINIVDKNKKDEVAIRKQKRSNEK